MKILNSVLDFITAFIRFVWFGWITLVLVFSGPIGWILLYLWKKEQNANIRTL